MISDNRKNRNILKISQAIYEHYSDSDGDFSLNGLINYFNTRSFPYVRNGMIHSDGAYPIEIQREILWVYYTELIRYNVTLIEFELL